MSILVLAAALVAELLVVLRCRLRGLPGHLPEPCSQPRALKGLLARLSLLLCAAAVVR